MSKFYAIVEDRDAGVRAFLAAEALRRAAEKTGRAIEIEVRTEQGPVNPLPEGAPAAGDTLLLVGPEQASDPALASRADSRLTLDAVLSDPDAALGADTAAPAAGSDTKRIVAVTSCPTGIAHTFMAAEGLQAGAAQLGYDMRVETQGSVGAGTPLTAEEIAAADIVIIAADREVDRARFAGKRVFASSTKPAISGGAKLIARALDEAETQGGEVQADGASGNASGKQERTGPYKHLMTGVSFMLPFVVAGGLLIAMAFALGGVDANADAAEGTLAHALFQIGASGGFALIVPALAGYIAFSIADRPGIAPGMIGGMLANSIGAGFLGGIVAGFVAGYGVYWLNRWIQLPKNLQGLKPVLVLPVLGTLLTGLLMIYAIGTPVAALLNFMTEWLRSMQGSSALLLGAILGAMMALDMGGPVNKAAYAFSIGVLASGIYGPMAATMAAGMTPPLAAALATRLFKWRFSLEEREAGGAAAVLGLAFVTEGAIPFAARDPLRMIPALMAGSALAGAISMAVGVELRTPHGGIFVLPIPGAVTHVGLYAVAIIAGTVLSAVLVGLLKRTAPAAAAA
ncbi:PTS fructose transporter subunit IIC [Croceicoccus mobilis]|uniref:protein-N(pi)-phosphohistidine--D-fructose phosphotransferase n=1 Tax=Croceicoccus mobilis TaxID=1703339 RepID=A0A917DWL7_9SPHN|nr:fructose-specific PTS transporter subunit EIIC [Croceicoccus mobilis]GGD74602.1 PTS system fructose-specific EIIB'BC component [Croceicoccus mobilis]